MAGLVPKPRKQRKWQWDAGFSASASSYAWTPGASCPDFATYSS
jgi:hypothetical protein